jgi:hypothetical protein
MPMLKKTGLQINRWLELPTTAMFMTAWVFEARHCPSLPNEIKKTKLQIYTSPQAGINILLAVVGLLLTLFKAVSFVTRYVTPIFINQSSVCNFIAVILRGLTTLIVSYKTQKYFVLCLKVSFVNFGRFVSFAALFTRF